MDDIVFIGDWVKDRILGSGSFGVVVLWKHKESNDQLAIKTCKWSNELKQKHRERWTQEVQMMTLLKHPNLVAARKLPAEFFKGLESVNPSKLPILCMEYCNGGDLRSSLNKIESCCGLKEQEVRNILLDLKNALHFLHENKITHRDLKPENIVMQNIDGKSLTSTNRRTIYKLIDLGYAKELDSNSMCASFVGTLQYLAPEIFYGKSYSNSVDYWSYGLVAFEVITGERPFLPSLAPVQWIPHAKKKSSEDICIYETFHGDIEYCSRIIFDNYLTEPFKSLLEKWLRIVLEFDPKKRGYDLDTKCVKFSLPIEEQENGVLEQTIAVFKQLDCILSKKILKIFSLYTYSFLSYEISDNLQIKTLKKFIEKDVNMNQHQQLLISTSFTILNDNDNVIKYWKDNCRCSVYLFDKDVFLNENCKMKVPIPVQRSIEQPKTLYNFNNSKRLYKSCYYFINDQCDLFEHFITGCFVRTEMLRSVGKEILLKQNNVDKDLGKVDTLETVLKKVLEICTNKIAENSTLTKMETFFSSAEALFEDIKSLKHAWTILTKRIQSAVRRSNEVNKNELNRNFFNKYNFEKLKKDMNDIFMNYKKNEKDFRKSDKQCLDAVKISFQCLKICDAIFQDIKTQPCLQKILDISVEYNKILSAIKTASDNVHNVIIDINKMLTDIIEGIWDNVGHSNYADLPYSLVAFEKNKQINFKIGEEETNHNPCIENGLPSMNTNDELMKLVYDSFKIRESYKIIKEQILIQNKLNDKFEI